MVAFSPPPFLTPFFFFFCPAFFLKFKYARPNGGEGGSHPSNLHDNAYAIGSINFTGDTGVMLGVDGPSLGGFLCPATIPASEFWKFGQLKPGDKIRYKRMTLGDALGARRGQDHVVQTLSAPTPAQVARVDVSPLRDDALAASRPRGPGQPVDVKYRIAGDSYVLVEYGEMVLDLNLRFRIHELERLVRASKTPGLIDTIPGVRTLLIQYDSRKLPPNQLLKLLQEHETKIPDVTQLKLPSRVWKLPMAFHDKWNREATERYMKAFRAEAPYLPDNVEFVAKNNGLSGVDAVRDIVFKASYMCLGLGDVYLGAPCAVPVDPRHRLTVPKYNPARTYTPEGSVGIGGTYMCIYPMESPGGYQLIGRTLPIWNRDANLPNFKNPWLLDMFDQVQFYQVSENDLEKMRTDFSKGTLRVDMKETLFDVANYNTFLKSIASETAAFKQRASTAAAEQMKIDADMQARAVAQKAERSKVVHFLADMAVNGPNAHHPGLNGLKPSKKMAAAPTPVAGVPAGKADSAAPPPPGFKQVFEKSGAEGFAKAVRQHRETRGALLMDTTWRDAHQSLLATRMRTTDILKIAPATAHVLHNCYSLENWGGATFDVALRFLKECPWDRLEKMRELVPNIPFQMLLRGANGVGYTSYPDNAVYEFCKQAVKSGMDIFRVFDSVNYLPNLQLGIEAVGAAGGISEGTLCYSGNVLNPRGNKYTLDYYLNLARELVKAGAHVLCVKDMAGLLTPNASRLLISALRKEFPAVPIHVHTHDSSNSGVAAMIACIESGADAVDVANDAMSGLTSQPAMGAVVYNFKGTALDTGIDILEMQRLTNYWELVRPQYEPFDSGQKSAGSDVWENEIPGGQYTNMFFQARSLGLEHEWANIKRAYGEANLLLGDIIKVTPSSKVVGDLAQFMVSKKLTPQQVVDRASELDFPSSVIEFLQGQLGIPLGGFPEPLRSRVLAKAGLTGIEGRPGASMPPLDMKAIQAKLLSKYGPSFSRWQDVNSYAMYPQVFDEYATAVGKFGQVTQLSTPAFLEPLTINESTTFTLGGKDQVSVTLNGVTKATVEPDVWNVAMEVNGTREVIPIKLKVKGSTPYVLKSAGGASSADPATIVVKANPSVPGQVGSPLPGKILRILAKEGTKVKKGDPLLVLNSMKMETTISSPTAGTVQLKVEAGADVVTGQLIVVVA